ncbi:MAG: DUF3570 domain-containing protein [Akkermansiaceae bacterium]|nr:DUF3570 domain-containing protein [Akkermansiaceae bacterium]
MKPRGRTLVLVPLICPNVRAELEDMWPQRYDYSYQLYQEDDDRIRVESHYIRGDIEINDETGFRFQWLNDAISGASPTGALPGSVQPFLTNLEDVRTGILGALSRQVGEHRIELEVSRSEEDDYISRGFALSDMLELNNKNTTVTYGLNYLDDIVSIPRASNRKKYTYDLFAGVKQIIDKNTLVSCNLTLGFSDGYLSDPYKIVQRTEIVIIPFIGPLAVDNIYNENRPGDRFRQVLQLEAKHYVEKADGAIDAVLRLSNDDFGVFSQTVQLEWRQQVGENFQVVPFFRYYHQSAADFFVQSIDGLAIGTPPANPDGNGLNYSADYRLSSFDALSGGLRLRYRFNDYFSASATYERYVMSGTGSTSNQAPGPAYPSANIWTFGLAAEF